MGELFSTQPQQCRQAVDGWLSAVVQERAGSSDVKVTLGAGAGTCVGKEYLGSQASGLQVQGSNPVPCKSCAPCGKTLRTAVYYSVSWESCCKLSYEIFMEHFLIFMKMTLGKTFKCASAMPDTISPVRYGLYLLLVLCLRGGSSLGRREFTPFPGFCLVTKEMSPSFNAGPDNCSVS